MAEIPSGTVTLLFTDIEGSTGLVQQLGEGYAALLNDQRQLIRAAVGEADGYEVDCRADELFASFQRAKDGVAAAVAAQQSLGNQTWPEEAEVRVRIGLHTGEPAVEGGVYFGLDVNRAARICSAGHGGQILLSRTTRDLVAHATELKDLGPHSLPGLPRPERIFQLLVPGLRTNFPPLRAEGAEPGLLKRVLPKARPRPPRLEDEAWRVRALLPQVAPPLQKPLAELGAALFTADRAATKADNFLSRVDRKRLARRVGAQRETAVVSQRARAEVVSLEGQIASLDRLLESRQALAGVAAELPSKLDRSLTERGIGSLRGRVAETTAQLDEALAQAASVLNPLSFRLERTRYRGIYRSGPKYVVPFVDTVGIDRRREFATLTEARDFREATRVAENAGMVAHWPPDRAAPRFRRGGGSGTDPW